MPTLHVKLRNTLMLVASSETKAAGKMALISAVNELMPAGKPDFLSVVKYPKISDLLKTEKQGDMLLYVSVLIRDFCSSMNVSRSMNEDQIVEAAAMLLTECGNFRLEDYTMMFAMAKRGQLVKIYERIDLSVITEMLDAYWQHRRDAAQQAQDEEINMLEGLGPSVRLEDAKTKDEKRAASGLDGFAGALKNLKDKWNAGKK
jgi:hypothetical protein